MDNANALFLKTAIGDRLSATALRHPNPTRGLISHIELTDVAHFYGVLPEWIIATYVCAIIPGETPLYDVGESIPPKLAKTRLLLSTISLDEDSSFQCACGADAHFDLLSLPGGWFPQLSTRNGLIWQEDIFPVFGCFAHLPSQPRPEPDQEDVEAVWNAYVASLREHGINTNFRLTPNLRSLISRRVKTFELSDVMIAVTCWHLSTWHLENKACTLEILLKEANIRRFCQLAQDRQPIDSNGGLNW